MSDILVESDMFVYVIHDENTIRNDNCVSTIINNNTDIYCQLRILSGSEGVSSIQRM